MCSWQRHKYSFGSQTHIFVCVVSGSVLKAASMSSLTYLPQHMGQQTENLDYRLQFFFSLSAMSEPHTDYLPPHAYCNTRQMCECIENSLSGITASHWIGMLKGFSLDKAYGLCRHLVYKWCIALIFNQMFS